MTITYQYSTCSNSAGCDVADVMNPSHRLGLGMNQLASHKKLSSPRPTNKGNIELSKSHFLKRYRYETWKTHPHKFQIEEDRRKWVLAVPVLVENWNIDGWIQSSLSHPSDLLTKSDLSDVWFEEVIFRGTQDWRAGVANTVRSIISLSSETIHKLVTSKYVVMECEYNWPVFEATSDAGLVAGTSPEEGQESPWADPATCSRRSQIFQMDCSADQFWFQKDHLLSESTEHKEGRIYVQLGRQSVHQCDWWFPYHHQIRQNLQMETCGGPFDVWTHDRNCRCHRHHRHWWYPQACD